jgi:hypothetical protein
LAGRWEGFYTHGDFQVPVESAVSADGRVQLGDNLQATLTSRGVRCDGGKRKDEKEVHMRRNRRVARIISSVVPLLSVAWLAGCATTVPLTKQVRESTRSVSIDKSVKLPGDMFYQGRGQSVGMAFGLIGAAIAAATAEGPKGQLKAAMREAQIDVGEIVREQFATELIGSGMFPSILQEGADVQVKLEVRIFGFGQPHGFSAQLKPMLGVEGTMVRSDGSVIWQRYDYVTNLSDKTPSQTLEQYLEKPELIRDAFTMTAKLVVADLVRHMREN